MDIDILILTETKIDKILNKYVSFWMDNFSKWYRFDRKSGEEL